MRSSQNFHLEWLVGLGDCREKTHIQAPGGEDRTSCFANRKGFLHSKALILPITAQHEVMGPDYAEGTQLCLFGSYMLPVRC